MTNIVLLVRDRYALTLQCLESLYENTPNQATWNLVIVNDGSEDIRVKRLLAAWPEVHSNCSVLNVANSGHVLSQLKNVGVGWSWQRWGCADDDWIYLGDGDSFFLPGWFEKLTAFAELAEGLDFKLFGGQVHPFHAPIDNIREFRTERLIGTQHEVLDGPSWFMRWSTWCIMYGFDRTTAPGVCQSEEYAPIERLKAQGGRIGVIHPHVVIHTGLTHADGSDCVGRKEREALLPPGILAL